MIPSRIIGALVRAALVISPLHFGLLQHEISFHHPVSTSTNYAPTATPCFSSPQLEKEQPYSDISYSALQLNSLICPKTILAGN